MRRPYENPKGEVRHFGETGNGARKVQLGNRADCLNITAVSNPGPGGQISHQHSCPAIRAQPGHPPAGRPHPGHEKQAGHEKQPGRRR
ncbi:hypothetical protein GCM10027456_54440 [Kineosporia babensis]